MFSNVGQDVDDLSEPLEVGGDGLLLLHADSGWHGHLAFGLSSVAKLPMALYCRMALGRIPFLRLTSPVEKLYGLTSKGR